MDWLKRLMGKKIVLGEGSNETFDKTVGALHGVRRGMWVVIKNSSQPVGIVTALSSDGTARVMLTDGKGENRVEVDVPVVSVRQASWTDIPAPRRPAKDLAAAYGYRTKPR